MRCCPFAVHQSVKNAINADIAMLCGCAEDAADTLQHRMPNNSLAQDNGCNVIAIHTHIIMEEMNTHAYSYTIFRTKEGPFPLVDVHSADVCV